MVRAVRAHRTGARGGLRAPTPLPPGLRGSLAGPARASAPETPPDTPADTAKKVSAVAVPAALAASAAVLQEGALQGPLTSYLNAVGVPVLQFLNPPAWVEHWFHAINMSTVLFAMGGYGTYLGYRIRAGEGGEATFGTPDTAAELHPKLMAGMLFFFLLGGQGGLVFTLLAGKPILETPHAVSAFAGLGLLAGQGVLGATMGPGETRRTIHTYLGSAIMLLFVVHAALGLNLGLSGTWDFGK